MFRSIETLAFLAIIIPGAWAQEVQVPLPPDVRMKTDVLLIVAHPDDETAIGSLLARLVLDEQKRVSIIYCNSGTGGGNSAGNEQAAAMGLIRETEARAATLALGITDIWFLDGRDTPGQDPFRSLQEWGHGRTLEQIVRLIRLTRPEIILTWLPHQVAGENHGDHQASGILATEGFDLSGDPAVFPAQVAAARERADIGNANEGLLPWQPKKIYYFSDASHRVEGPGPPFDIEAVSPSRKLPYYKLAGSLHLPHKTQGDVSEPAERALQTGDYSAFKAWLRQFTLIFGKAVVRCAPGGLLFEGILPGPVPFVRLEPAPRREVAGLALGGVYAFYRDFWRTHGVEHLGPLVESEIEVAAGSYFHVPLQFANELPDTVRVSLSPVLPPGWVAMPVAGAYVVPPHSMIPIQTFFRVQGESSEHSVQVGWKAVIRGAPAGTVTIRTSVKEWTLPQ
jgi:LmbE family N-acetylglucosaminyl deacetylase